MTRITAATEITTTATSIDFSNNALSEQLIVISFFYDADEFVTDRSRETCVSSRNLEVGITNAGEKHTHKCFTAGFWFVDVAK